MCCMGQYSPNHLVIAVMSPLHYLCTQLRMTQPWRTMSGRVIKGTTWKAQQLTGIFLDSVYVFVCLSTSVYRLVGRCF